MPLPGELLRGHRRRLGLSQEELADRSGVSVRTISHVETGRIARPRLTTVRQLADALDLTGPLRAEFQEAATGAAATPVPNQLPPAHVLFTGRTEQLDHLAATHHAAGDPATAVLLRREAADPLPGPGRL
ncbi:helix-turn-helix transcriptional regulator [Streptomyces acidiscabies]|uniref:helix-turn-helix transcriptional regulator n=1 Tax=Streptomyces acidiscabies TaxID=42234 RepID=UPI0038F5ED93